MGMGAEDAENSLLFTHQYTTFISRQLSCCVFATIGLNAKTRGKCRGETSEVPANLQARWRVFTTITSTPRIIERHSHDQENMAR